MTNPGGRDARYNGPASFEPWLYEDERLLVDFIVEATLDDDFRERVINHEPGADNNPIAGVTDDLTDISFGLTRRAIIGKFTLGENDYRTVAATVFPTFMRLHTEGYVAMSSKYTGSFGVLRTATAADWLTFVYDLRDTKVRDSNGQVVADNTNPSRAEKAERIVVQRIVEPSHEDVVAISGLVDATGSTASESVIIDLTLPERTKGTGPSPKMLL